MSSTTASHPTAIVSCPTCGKLVAWEAVSRYRPFCSERCKLIDLGDWATERFRIPDDTSPDSTDPTGSPPA